MDEKKPTNPWTKSLLVWMGVLFGLVLVVNMFGSGKTAAGAAIPYSQFVREVDEGNVKSVTVATTSIGNSAVAGTLDNGKNFTTTAPAGSNVADASD